MVHYSRYLPAKIMAALELITGKEGKVRFSRYLEADIAGRQLNTHPDILEAMTKDMRDFFCEEEELDLDFLKSEAPREWTLEHDHDSGYWKLTREFTEKNHPRLGFEGHPWPAPDAKMDCELRWSCWSSEEDYWPENRDQIRTLTPGRMIRISVSSRKEIRGGEVEILRTSENTWKVEGHFTSGWDDLHDLADTLNQVLVSYGSWDDYFGDWDLKGRPVEQMKRYLMEEDNYDEESAQGIAETSMPNDEQAFAESIPFSMHRCDPGVDRDFSFEFEGTVEALMARIDKEEDALITESEEAWNEIKEMYRDPTEESETCNDTPA